MRSRTDCQSNVAGVDFEDNRLAREAWITQPREDEIGIHIVAPRDLAHRDAGNSRLRADHPLLIVRPDPPLPTLRHPLPR